MMMCAAQMTFVRDCGPTPREPHDTAKDHWNTGKVYGGGKGGKNGAKTHVDRLSAGLACGWQGGKGWQTIF